MFVYTILFVSDFHYTFKTFLGLRILTEIDLYMILTAQTVKQLTACMTFCICSAFVCS